MQRGNCEEAYLRFRKQLPFQAKPEAGSVVQPSVMIMAAGLASAAAVVSAVGSLICFGIRSLTWGIFESCESDGSRMEIRLKKGGAAPRLSRNHRIRKPVTDKGFSRSNRKKLRERYDCLK